MSDYTPPTEDLPIFDVTVFNSGDEPLTYNQAKKKFLRYPTAQGKETLQAIDVNGISTFKNNIIQSGQELNIVQIDTDSNTTPNSLRATNITGDLNLFRPSGGNGGALALRDVGGTGSFMQIYQSGAVSNLISLNAGGFVQLIATNNPTPPTNPSQITIYRGSAITGTLIQTNKTDSGNNAQLRVTDLNSKNCVSLYANAGVTDYNPITQAGDNLVFANNTDNTINTENMVLTTNSSTKVGVRITPAGNMELAGACNFSSTTAPTSAQTIPASNDSSNKIPTTAWVQSAISSTPTQFVPKFKNYTNVQTTSGSGYSSGINVNFNGTWNINDEAYFRVTSQVSYTDNGSGYENTGNSMGVLLVRPYYTFSAWGGVSPGVSTIVQMCNNSPGSIMGANKKIAFYTPCYNIGGVQNFIISGGVNTLRFGVLSFQTTGGWTYFLSVEYIGACVSAGGTVVLSNGTGITGEFTNDTLP